MVRRNGIMTFFVLWLGSMLLVIAWQAMDLAQRHYEEALRYYDGIEAAYLAESILRKRWVERQQGLSDEPDGELQVEEDPWSLGESGKIVRTEEIFSEEAAGNQGTITVQASLERSHIDRTARLVYERCEDEPGKFIYHIQSITY